VFMKETYKPASFRHFAVDTFQPQGASFGGRCHSRNVSQLKPLPSE